VETVRSEIVIVNVVLYHIQLLIIKLEGTIHTASGITQLSQTHLNILQATEAIIKELTVEVLKVYMNDCESGAEGLYE
jgi:hypothetical protein